MRSTASRAMRVATPALLAAIVALGAALRLDQFAVQVLLDDEWHAVHQVLRHAPAAFVLDLGVADYGIPLALYDWALVRTVGLSETALRLPMMLCGLATLVVLPLAVAPRVGRDAALAFALLLATSPLLIAYSQIGRPYAINLMLGWVAHGAFHRYWAGSARAGAVYALATALAVWLHLLIAPFVLAPLAWAAWRVLRERDARRALTRRWIAIAVPTLVALALLVGPPLWNTPSAIAGKSGFAAPEVNTVRGAYYLWIGSTSSLVAVATLVLGAMGAPAAWRALPEVRTGAIGLALTAVALAITRPEWGQVPIVFARYLLPAVPMLLLAIALGGMTVGRAAVRRWRWPHATALGATVASLGIASALAATGPLPAWHASPTTHRLGVGFLYDLRDHRNAALAAQRSIPLSPWWSTLAARPRASTVVAVAPFNFESYDWDAARWERVSGQRVVPGWLTGLCVDRRPGELPAGEGFRFANAVRLADAQALAAFPVDYVAWQKPWLPREQDRHVRYGDDTARCEPALRSRFGAQDYEDAPLVVFDAPRR